MKIEIEIAYNFRRTHIEALTETVRGYLEDYVNYKIPETSFTTIIETDDPNEEDVCMITITP